MAGEPYLEGSFSEFLEQQAKIQVPAVPSLGEYHIIDGCLGEVPPVEDFAKFLEQQAQLKLVIDAAPARHIGPRCDKCGVSRLSQNGYRWTCLCPGWMAYSSAFGQAKTPPGEPSG
jgi:hypothetical protein